MPLDSLVHADFAPHLHETFTLRAADGTVEVELASATERPARWAGPNGKRRPFSLIYLGPEGQNLPEGHYEMTSPSGENLVVFFVPLGWEAGRMRLQAVFS